MAEPGVLLSFVGRAGHATITDLSRLDRPLKDIALNSHIHASLERPDGSIETVKGHVWAIGNVGSFLKHAEHDLATSISQSAGPLMNVDHCVVCASKECNEPPNFSREAPKPSANTTGVHLFDGDRAVTSPISGAQFSNLRKRTFASNDTHAPMPKAQSVDPVPVPISTPAFVPTPNLNSGLTHALTKSLSDFMTSALSVQTRSINEVLQGFSQKVDRLSLSLQNLEKRQNSLEIRFNSFTMSQAQTSKTVEDLGWSHAENFLNQKSNNLNDSSRRSDQFSCEKSIGASGVFHRDLVVIPNQSASASSISHGPVFSHDYECSPESVDSPVSAPDVKVEPPDLMDSVHESSQEISVASGIEVSLESDIPEEIRRLTWADLNYYTNGTSELLAAQVDWTDSDLATATTIDSNTLLNQFATSIYRYGMKKFEFSKISLRAIFPPAYFINRNATGRNTNPTFHKTGIDPIILGRILFLAEIYCHYDDTPAKEVPKKLNDWLRKAYIRQKLEKVARLKCLRG